MRTSKIATIVYKEYTENIDMLNPLFKQSELDALAKTDKSILRIDYYVNGVLVGNKIYSEKQAAAQILKMNSTAAKIEDTLEYEAGSDWREKIERNKVKNAKIQEIQNKIAFYSKFMTEQGYNDSDLPCTLCMDWEDFKD